MKNKKKEEIINTMLEIKQNIAEDFKNENKELVGIEHYDNFKIKGKRANLQKDDIYKVKIRDNSVPEKEMEPRKKEEAEVGFYYEIYDKDQNLIATIDENGKIKFEIAFLEQLGEDNIKLLGIDDDDFDLTEEIGENDISLTKEEIDNKLNDESKDKKKKESIEEKQEREEKKNLASKNEDEKKEEVAASLGVQKDDIKAIATLDPTKKVTDTENLIDIYPQTAEYREVEVIYAEKQIDGSADGQFVLQGIKADGTREIMKGTEPVEGTSTDKDIISINEDGSKVTRKQVQGLLRINSGNREDGISMTFAGDGRLEMDYVRNIDDKERRRAIPMETEELNGQKEPTYEVKENAGDSKEEIEREGNIFNHKEDKGIDPQSLDGIDTDREQGYTLADVKRQIVKEVAEEGVDLSRAEIDELIKGKIYESGLELTNEELDRVTEQIHTEAIDEMTGNRERRY